jgi:aryl-alcohol dehydrogenase-like predicted oxidoreductase
MQTRQLGNSGLHLTTVGFGAWAIGGGGWAFGWGPQDDDASIAAMRHAVELGINWIDTAAVYGLGHSEEVVGRLLRQLPPSDRPFVFTKCGLAWDERDRMKPAQRNLEPAVDPQGVRGVAPPARRRAHRPVPVPLADETGHPGRGLVGGDGALVEEGKVRAAGVSNFGVELLERCEAIRHVDSLQPPFSLIRRDVGARGDPVVRRARHGRDLL